MLSEKMQTALNEQIRMEAESSQIYLAMASWAEIKALKVLRFLCSGNLTKKGSTCLSY